MSTQPLKLAGVMVALAAAALTLAGACADGEVLRPAPIDNASTVSSGSGGAGGAGGGGSFSPRTVIVRDPLGAVHKTRNLLWDGDFEWLPSFEDQYGWLYGPTAQQISYALPPLTMGARCRSGVKCARLPTNGALLGLAVAWQGNPLEISVFSAPEDGSCAGLDVFLVSQSGDENGAVISPVADKADEQGWCQHSGVLPERKAALYLYLERHGSPTIIDDVSIEPVEPAAMQAKSLPPASERQLDAATVARIRAWGRAAREPRVPPPSEGEKRLRQHMRKRFGVRK